MTWRDEAACIGTDTDLFFPPTSGRAGSAGGRRARETIAQAKRVCSRCTVRAECLDIALSTSVSEDFGVWGGTTPDERRRLRGKGRAA